MGLDEPVHPICHGNWLKDYHEETRLFHQRHRPGLHRVADLKPVQVDASSYALPRVVAAIPGDGMQTRAA